MPRLPQHLTIADLPREHLLGGTYQRTAVRGDHSLVTFNWMDPAMPPQPPHSHPFDQVSLVTEGAMEFLVDDETYLVEAGEAVLIPADARHTGVAVGEVPALNIDVYAPPRADYLHLVAHQDPDGTAFLPPGPAGPRDQHDVERLLADWADRLDSGRAHEVADLLTDDAVVVGLGPDRYGPDGMRAWADERAADRRTQHHVSTVRCSVRSDGSLACRAYVTVYVVDAAHPEPERAFVGRYDDVVVRTPGGLRFARREVVPFR